MNPISTLCVFCGSSPGKDRIFTEKTIALAKMLVRHNITLVYGGSNVGIMRILADTMLSEKGKVIGVMPNNLIEREVAHLGLTEFHVVDTMHERKALMVKLSDAFIALPGGLGTMDELFEALSWNQLEIISKPVGLLNIKGYYDHLLNFLNHAVDQQFIKQAHHHNLLVDDDENRLMAKLQLFKPLKVEGGKWISELKTDTDKKMKI